MLLRISLVYMVLRSGFSSRLSPKPVALAVFALAACLSALSVPAQQQSQPVAGQNHDNLAAAQGSEPTVESLPYDRQLQIAQQSAGLLQMAKDLKAELEATSNDTFSVAAFRKADAIERFTQLVKDQNKHRSRKP